MEGVSECGGSECGWSVEGGSGWEEERQWGKSECKEEEEVS